MDPRRLADIRAGDARQRRTRGSGYLIGPRLVLTARHVVVKRKTGRSWTRIAVRVGHPDAHHGPIAQRRATVCWTHPDGEDVALLELDKPVQVPGRVRWGRPVGTTALPYTGLGFPLHTAGADGARGIEQLRGMLPPLASGGPGGGLYVLDQEAAPRLRSDGLRAWGGVSGAAVFCQDLLVGVAIWDDEEHENRRLHAIPAHVFATEPAFTAHVTTPGGPVPELTPVDAQPLPDEPLELRIDAIDPLTDLDVHQPIDIQGSWWSPSLPKLPIYVERPHDAKLRQITKAAADGKSRLLVLVGGSSTGKTRACWEAIQALPDHWRLWLYEPSPSEAALETLDRIRPHTVVWLDEIQRHLITPGSPDGEDRAAGLRNLLNAPGRAPVLILGTVWPKNWDRLTTQPADGAEDPHSAARMLLTGHDLIVPETFTDVDLANLETATEHDPRLAYAAEHAEQGHITQFLAGAPALLECYHTARHEVRALIEAAMDARLVGHSPALPVSLLETAAEGYLTEIQWDLLPEDWLRTALHETGRPIHGIRGPLSPIRSRRGRPSYDEPHYLLSDVLEQHALTTRQHRRVPESVWQALVDHAQPNDQYRMATELHMRMRHHDAWLLCAAAAEAGIAPPLMAAHMARDARLTDEALVWYERAADAGDTDALWEAAHVLEVRGRSSEALVWYERAAEDTIPPQPVVHVIDERHFAVVNPSPMLMARAEALQRVGLVDEALVWYERAADAGDTDALWEATLMMWAAGRTEQALTLYQHAVESGDLDLWSRAKMLRDAGMIDQARELYQHAADSGDNRDVWSRAAMLRDAGMIDQALDWYRRAADSGETLALWDAAAMLRNAGLIDQALDWYRRAADKGDSSALLAAANMMRKAGLTSDAQALQQQAAERGCILPARRRVRRVEGKHRPYRAPDAEEE